MEELDDDELALVVTSLSITSDALWKKQERQRGARQAEAKAKYAVCDRVLTRFKAEQTARTVGGTQKETI